MTHSSRKTRSGSWILFSDHHHDHLSTFVVLLSSSSDSSPLLAPSPFVERGPHPSGTKLNYQQTSKLFLDRPLPYQECAWPVDWAVQTSGQSGWRWGGLTRRTRTAWFSSSIWLIPRPHFSAVAWKWTFVCWPLSSCPCYACTGLFWWYTLTLAAEISTYQR